MTGSGLSALKDRLRAGCREALRENPEWRRQAGTVSRNRFRQGAKSSLRWFLVVGVSAALGAALGHEADGGQLTKATSGLALASLMLAWCFISSNWLKHRCHGDYNLFAYSLLPVSNEWIVRRQFGKWARVLWPTMLACVLAMVGLGFQDASGWRQWSGSLLGGVGLGLLISSVAVCAERHTWLNRILFPVCLAGWVALIFLRNVDLFWSGVVPWLNAHSDQLAWLVPTAWVIRPVQEFFQGGPYSSLPLLLPAATLVWFAWWEVRLLIAQLRPRDEVLVRYAAQLPDDASPELEAEFHQAIDRPPDASEPDVVATMQSRGFLTGEPPPRDWTTRLAWHWWSPRQRILARWVGATRGKFDRRWLLGLVLLLVAALVGRTVQGIESGLFALILAGALGMVVVLPIWPMLGNVGQSVPVGYGFVRGWMTVPATLGEYLATERKLAVVRLLMAVPLIALAVWILQTHLGREAVFARDYVLRFVVIVWAFRSLVLVMHVTRGMAATSLSWALLGVFYALTLIVAACFGIVGAVMHGPPGWVCVTVAFLLVTFLGRLTLFLWARRRMDAVHLKPDE